MKHLIVLILIVLMFIMMMLLMLLLVLVVVLRYIDKENIKEKLERVCLDEQECNT